MRRQILGSILNEKLSGYKNANNTLACNYNIYNNKYVCHKNLYCSTAESCSRRDELSTKTDDTERVVKFAKICEINQESRTIPVDTSTKDIALSLKEYRRRHEDSGIEMSPTKKDENLEGQDFLEAARKVSSIEAISINGDRRNGYCNCNCNHEAACFDRFSMQQNFIELNSVNDNRCLPLPNAS